MRRIFLILLIALLPIRMWAAEGMSVRMAEQGMMGTSMAMDAMDEMPADCPMRASAGQEAPSDGTKGAATACLTCQLCAALAALAGFQAAAVSSPSFMSPSIASSFDSADPLHEIKPPIS